MIELCSCIVTGKLDDGGTLREVFEGAILVISEFGQLTMTTLLLEGDGLLDAS